MPEGVKSFLLVHAWFCRDAASVSETAQKPAEAAVFVKIHLSTGLSEPLDYRKAPISVAKAISFLKTSTYDLLARPDQCACNQKRGVSERFDKFF